MHPGPTFLIGLALLALSQANYCTYTLYEWSHSACAAQNVSDTTCGVGWCALLAVDAASMLLPQNQAWLLAFHQYGASILNRRQLLGANLTNGTRLVDLATSGVDAALALVGDSLEVACGNVTKWVVTPSLSRALELLFTFNHGGLAPACEDEFPDGNVTQGETTFYYYNPPDVIALRQSGSNLTVSTPVLRQVYGTQLFLLLTAIVEFVVICLLLLALIIYRSEQRHYLWCMKNATGVNRGEAVECDIELDMLNETSLEGSGSE
jgi:hypothetical protein